MNTVAFKRLLKTKISEVVYADFVPEGKALPAVAFTHVADGFTRILNGNKSGLWNTWRVMCVGANRAESELLAEKLKELDNTSSTDFQNVFIIAEGNTPASPEDKTRTAFVDIKTYG